MTNARDPFSSKSLLIIGDERELVVRYYRYVIIRRLENRFHKAFAKA